MRELKQKPRIKIRDLRSLVENPRIDKDYNYYCVLPNQPVSVYVRKDLYNDEIKNRIDPQLIMHWISLK